MKVQLIVLVLAAGLSVAACRPQPAYKDINTNQPAKAEPPPAPAGAPETAPSPTAGQAAPTAPAPTQPFKPPAFMDTANGYPKDLPNYPEARVLNVQFGPQAATDMFSVAMQTHDPMDKITAFYDKVVKGNGWTVKNRVVDPEYSEWLLQKEGDNEAKVTVQKDKKTSWFVIVAARIGKQPEPAAKPQS